MNQLSDLILQILTQIGGGPETPENNLVRFTLPAIFWAILLAVAWSRQRQGNFPRERLLVWGFGLALFRELFMLAHLSEKLLSEESHQAHSSFVEPIEHALSIAAILVITAAFLRYILDDPVLPRRYLAIGLGVTITGYIATASWWPRQVVLDPGAKFNMTGAAWLLHGIELFLIAAAIAILIKNKSWLSNVVIIALSFLFLSELIALINYMNGHVFGHVLCPVGNNLHIWAVPIFGFVYFREQGIEKRKAETALRAYRDHLQELVDIRTAELQNANKQLERAAVLEERQRIAANMHDGLAQTLSSLGLRTGQAATMLQAGNVGEVIADFDDMQDIIGRAVTDVRRSIASLQQGPQPKRSLQETLAESLQDSAFCKSGAEVELSTISEPLFLNPNDREQVVRVVQEALLNACRHAHAKKITINLQRQPAAFLIAVTDDGLGFDPNAADKESDSHFGLSIMRARAARIDGRLTIISTPGQGTSVQLIWPAERIPPEDAGPSPFEEFLRS